MIVTIDADKLQQQLAVAGLSTGNPVTGGELRRLACIAGIIPAVRRRPALRLPPPPRPRHSPRPDPLAQRRLPLPPADVGRP